MRREEQEKCHEWIDKTIDRMLLNTSILTLICALMSAFACYMFVQLPYYTYSYHVLREIFLTVDSLFEKNGYPKGYGLRIIAPLPAVIISMYSIVVYFIYLVNYPKQNKLIHYGVKQFININYYIYIFN